MTSLDKCQGAYIGAAIGDAMGGPVECNHYVRIKKHVGVVRDLLPYKKPYTLIELGPGYALSADAGSVTDDTFIRADFTKFFIENKDKRTPETLVEWLMKNARFSHWWGPAVEAVQRVQSGQIQADKGGTTHPQGGGIGWWTPLGIIYAGQPEKAAYEARSLSRIWKDELEQDFIGTVAAGISEAVKTDATYQDVIEVMLRNSHGLTRKLLERALKIGDDASDVWDLAQRLYETVLIGNFDDSGWEPPRKLNAPIPDITCPLDYREERYSSVYISEQVPLALAAFTFAKGKPDAIPICCSLGRDCDTTATTVGAWVGGICGESGLPEAWIHTVQEINLKDIDIKGLGQALYLAYHF